MTERSVLVRLRANVTDFNRSLATAAVMTRSFTRELDSSNSHASMLVQSLMAIAPALTPLGGGALVMLSSLASSLAFTAGAGVTAAIAFQGVGDALGKLNDYQLDPSAENLAKVKEEFDKLGPAGQRFVVFLQDLRPQMQELQDIAQEGWFPGLQEGMESALEQMPIFEQLVENTAEAMGRLSADAGETFNDPFWTEFFEFLSDEAGPSLETFLRSMGNITEAMAAMWMAMEPLNNDFADGMLDSTESFAKWAKELDESEGFENFVEYLRKNGPQVMATLGGLGNAFISLIQASAPLGGPTLRILEALADTISAVADSPAGPVLLGTAAGLAAISRAVALFNIANGSALAQFIGKAGEDGKKAIPAIRGVSAVIGTLALSMTDLDERMGLSNTATLAMMGTIAGPWGAAIGAGVGLTMDLAAANNDLTDAIEGAREAARGTDIGSMTDELEILREEIAETESALDRGLNSDPILNLFRDDTDYANLGEFALGQLNRRVEGIKAALGGISDVASGAYRDGLGEIERLEQRIFDLQNGAEGVDGAFKDALLPTLDTTAEGFDIATLAADEFVASLEDVNAILEGRSNWREYQAALDDAAEIFTKRAEIQREIAEVRSDMQDDLADARGDLARAETPSSRDSARDRIARIEESAADRIADLEQQLADLAVTLDTDFDIGRENEENLDRIAATALKVAEDLEGMDRIEFLRDARRGFIDAAVDLGMTRKAARELAEELHLVDEVRAKPEVEVVGGDDAEKTLEDIRHDAKLLGERPPVTVDLTANDRANPFLELLAENIGKVDGKTVTIDARVRRPGDQEFNAAGGMYRNGVRFYAGGDVANAHQPEIAGPGSTVRIWREQETRGESYIPHADDWRRPRAIRIWEDTGRILGVNFRRFAAGGTYQPTYAAAPAPAGGGVEIDYDRLTRALLAARPLYGPVTVQGDGSFRRELENDKNIAALGGMV